MQDTTGTHRSEPSHAPPFVVRRAAWVIAAAVLLTTGAILAATRIDAEVDFVDTVPDHAGLEPYRTLLSELDGVRFFAVYEAHDPSSDTDHLRGEGFDALVRSQEAWTLALQEQFPGSYTHHLNVFEGMRQGNYMLAKIATAGNPPESAYALPEDPVTWDAVKQQALDGGSLDDVLAKDGASALSLHFLATESDAEARHVVREAAAFLAAWTQTSQRHPVTTDHAPTGLVWASAYTDRVNQEETLQWAPVAAGASALALLWALRRPSNVLIAVLSTGCALAWTYGAIGLIGRPISFLTLFLAPVVVGIGVDYAIHVLHRFEEERTNRSRQDAASAAVRTVGPAVRTAALTTSAALAILWFVPADLFAEIGALGALGILFGFGAAVTLTPALRALLPDRPRRAAPATGPRRSFGDRLAVIVDRMGRQRRMVAGLLVVLLVVAGVVVATQTRIESGSAENEFPQDDPTIALQRRIEADYGAFQRGYLVIEGDLANADALRAVHAAVGKSTNLPLFLNASAVTDLLLADEATDQGAVDIGLGALLGPTPAARSEEERLPASDEEAQAALDRLFEDPLWRSIAPFAISRDYQVAVVAVKLEPWPDQDALTDLRDAFLVQAADLQDALGAEYEVAAAGAPMNRAAIVEQTPIDVAIAAIGSTTAVFGILALSWRKRGTEGVRAAGVAAAVVLAACLLLLAAIPALDAYYGWAAATWGAAANNAALNDMFLLAFAVTVAVGVDDVVHVVHRYWEGRDAGRSARTAWLDALRGSGRAITGTTLTTMAAFAAMSGVYFLQSKNLAILTTAGVLFAYLLSLSLLPWALWASMKRDTDPEAP